MAVAQGVITIESLLPKLHGLSKERMVERRVGREIMWLIAELEGIRSHLGTISDAGKKLGQQQLDQQVRLWAEDAMKMSEIDKNIVKFETRCAQPGSATGFIARINWRLSAAKARREFVGDIKDAKRMVQDLVDRHGRYRIDDSTYFPFRPAPDLVVDGQRDEVTDTETMETELDICKSKVPSGVKSDIDFLEADLKIVTAVLRKIAEMPAGELDDLTEAWAQDLRDVSRNFKLAVDDFRARISGGPSQWTMSSMKAGRRFARKIRSLKDCLLEVAERRQRYDLRELRVPKRQSDDHQAAVGARLPDLESIVGIGEHTESLEQFLTDESLAQLRLASIVGQAGVGKTTLARAVYCALAPRFDCAAWVSLPTLPAMEAVLHDLLRQIDEQNRQPTSSEKGQLAAPDAALQAMAGAAALVVKDERDLIDKICQRLRNKRYFVVIDGIWDLAAWNTLKHALIRQSNGSAVLTTSRKVETTEYVGGVGRVYRLDPLSNTDSRKLFRATFSHPGLAGETEKFIEKCGGIPAAIIATAVSLASNPWTVKEWYQVHGSADYKLDARSILDKSYNELSFHLQYCLLYLSMFPKGCQISGEHLVWQWIAEGFIQEIQGQTLQEVGENYLIELIRRKFINSAEVDAEGKPLSCCVYDFVYDFIISKSSEENFATVIGGSESRTLPQKNDRLSFQGNSSDQSLLQQHVSGVKTLMFYSDAKLMPSMSYSGQLLALDLGGCDSLKNDDLKGIANSFRLKYLAIGGNCITDLPKEIASLKLLQSLDLRACSLKELPECVVLVPNLVRLRVNSHVKIPDCIGKMKALEELGDINISKPEILKELRKLTRLRVIRMAIWTWDESYNEALIDYLRSLVVEESMDLSGFIRERTNSPFLRRLNLLKLCSQRRPLASQLSRNQIIQSLSILTSCSLHFMDNLGANWAPPGLKNFEIRESSFFALPQWIASLQNLSSLTIEVYTLSQEMVNILGKLQSLCSLSLTSKHAPEGNFGTGPDGFRKLTSFNFATDAMPKMFELTPKSVQMLRRLQLSFKALQTAGINQEFNFGIEDLCSLEHVRVEIVCFNASSRVVEKAEAAILEAISWGPSRCPTLEIRRVREEDMVESEDEVVLSDIKQEQQKETKNNKKSSSRKIRVISKKFRQKEKGVPRKYRIVSLHLKSHILTLQAL